MTAPKRPRTPAALAQPDKTKINAFRPHPWHGLDIGRDPPEYLNAYIEITPFDLMKYEVDKVSGYLRIDRPQRSSAQPPTLYGFIPRTFCDENVRALSPTSNRGDGDPLDICVLSERAITRNEIIVRCRVIGGLQMVDHGDADDKIVAVLENDYVWGNASEISDIPPIMVERLQHYMLTYKLIPGEELQIQINQIYDREHALKVVRASMADYDAAFGS